MKRCSKCDEMRPLDEFEMLTNNGRRYPRTFCMECKNDYYRDRYHRQKHLVAARRNEPPTMPRCLFTGGFVPDSFVNLMTEVVRQARLDIRGNDAELKEEAIDFLHEIQNDTGLIEFLLPSNRLATRKNREVVQ